MIEVKGGTFNMGATPEQVNPYEDEEPVHKVTLSDYLIGETEVTQALWQAVTGTTVSQQRDKDNHSFPLKGEGANFPMYYVSWDDCQIFIEKLNAATGRTFRLPTEAEWEYAARGGNKSKGYQYSGSNNLDDIAWYNYDNYNTNKTTHPVKTKQPNELGIYDMSGNVLEWCQDWFGDYDSSEQTNPKGPASGSERVYRGGSFYLIAKNCRTAIRTYNPPNSRASSLGFRIVLTK